MIGKNPTDYIEEGNLIGFGTGTTNIEEVASITDGNTFETAASVTVADNAAIYIASTSSQTNEDYELMGLKGLIDDGTYVPKLEGLTRATYIWWKSYVNDNNGTLRTVTDALLHTTWLEAMKKGNTDYILTSYDVVSTYGQTLTSDRRYTNTDMRLNGGFKALDFNGIPMVPDYDAPYTDAFFIDKSTLSVEDLAPISFLNEDGAILSRSATTPAWNATLRYYANLCIKAPNKNARLSDLQ